MRPKFRVWIWDIPNEKWNCYPVEGLVWEYNPDKLFVRFKENEYPGICYMRVDVADIDAPILEQFTGKLDVDGKEIYEGDIIEFISLDFDGFGGGKKIIPVEYNCGEFFPLRKLHGYDIKVIGTIHD